MNNESREESFRRLRRVIAKSRVHFYKPIQIAEILYKARVMPGEIDLNDEEQYRKASKKWRDEVSLRLVGNRTTSSARYQDDIFREITPRVLANLVHANNKENGEVERYIYRKMGEKWSVLSGILDYAEFSNPSNFSALELVDMFVSESGMKRSIDKMYEVLTFTIMNHLIENTFSPSVELSYRIPEAPELQLFSNSILMPNEKPASIHRVGVANAADRGIDIVTNFGPTIQVKHLDLSDALVKQVIDSIPQGEIVLVVRDAGAASVASLLEDYGDRLKSILTIHDLDMWYEHILHSGNVSEREKSLLLKSLEANMRQEFPHLSQFALFMQERGYDLRD